MNAHAPATEAILAREAIRDLVVRYSANGDAGRFEQVLALFTADASMVEGDGRSYSGPAEIRTVFERARRHTARLSPPAHVRHLVTTHEIALVDASSASGRCDFLVITPVGIDHWGGYVDEYSKRDGAWLISARTVHIHGRSPTSIFTDIYRSD